MRLIVVRKNEFVECIDDIDQAHFYKDKVIMNRPPLNISVLPLSEEIASINCQDINMEIVKELEEKLKEKENMRLLDEKEFQKYCSFKHIEPEIRGCLDREREYLKQIKVLEKALELSINASECCCGREMEIEMCKKCFNESFEHFKKQAKEILDNERK